MMIHIALRLVNEPRGSLLHIAQVSSFTFESRYLPILGLNTVCQSLKAREIATKAARPVKGGAVSIFVAHRKRLYINFGTCVWGICSTFRIKI
jgi:hypothetical protein